MPTNPLRVLVVAQPQSGGVPNHILDLVAGSAAADVELTVACPPGSTLWRALEGHGQVRRRPFTSRRAPHPGDLLWMLRLLPLVRRSDAVHAHSTKAGLVVRAAALLAGRRTRCVFTPHGWSFWAVRGWRRRVAVGLERLAAHGCAAIVAVSDDERDAGLRSGIGPASRHRVIRNGVDLARFASVRTPEPARALMVARLSAQKRPLLAVRALAAALPAAPGLHLDIAGDGELRGEVEALAERLGVAASLRLLGDRDDVPALLASATCLLVTSAYEGCSLTVLEAMAAGVPVVAVDIGGMAELVEDGVTGVLTGESPAAIGAALARLVGDPAAVHRLGEAARTRARARFGRDRMVAGVMALWREVSRSRRR